MHALLRIAVALFVGFVTFAVAAVAGTELFFPRIEFSLFVGVPFGLWASIAVAGLLLAGLWYRDEGRPHTVPVIAGLWTAVAVALAFVVVSVVGFVWFFVFEGNVAVLLLIYGLPAAMVVAGLAALVAAVMRHSRDGDAGGEDGPSGVSAR